jgi:hypothetical protein
MSSELRDEIAKHTARQLGVREDQVTDNTIIPDIHRLVDSVGVMVDDCGFVNEHRQVYTVAQAVELLSR